MRRGARPGTGEDVCACREVIRAVSPLSARGVTVSWSAGHETERARRSFPARPFVVFRLLSPPGILPELRVDGQVGRRNGIEIQLVFPGALHVHQPFQATVVAKLEAALLR